MHSIWRAAAAMTFVLGTTPALAASFGAVYAFGDSLNDCCINPAAPFTNGPETWLPAFASAIGADYPTPETTARNYAIGGAQSGRFKVIPASDAGFGFNTGLLAQVGRFEASGTVVGASDLAVIWVGTNDIWPSAFNGDLLFGALPINKPVGTTPTTAALADRVARNVRRAASGLRDSGFGSLLVLTPFDIANSALIDNPDGPARNRAYSLAVRDRLMTLYTPGIDTFVLDMVSVIEGLQAGSPGNGFTSLTGFAPCNGGGIVCGDRTQAEQDSFIFNDFVHLTTATNAVISLEAAALLTNGAPVAPVPLPAPAALLLAGMGALVLLRRQRA
jgi:hypothetical protein